jgi:hypothetical protein
MIVPQNHFTESPSSKERGRNTRRVVKSKGHEESPQKLKKKEKN